eukprot:scaffold20267_cov114-Isochrysis_galbana.AAC.4
MDAYSPWMILQDGPRPPRNVGQPNLLSPLITESSPIVRSKGSRGSCGHHRAVVVHAALNPSPRKWRPEEGEGMGDEWESGGGVTGRYWTEVSRRVAASV